MGWSGWPDLNRRPHAPQACALPGCATPRPFGRRPHRSRRQGSIAVVRGGRPSPGAANRIGSNIRDLGNVIAREVLSGATRQAARVKSVTKLDPDSGFTRRGRPPTSLSGLSRPRRSSSPPPGTSHARIGCPMTVLIAAYPVAAHLGGIARRTNRLSDDRPHRRHCINGAR
jgi:hypothetical protein